MLRFNHFPQTAIHQLNRLSGINRPTNLGRESKERDNVRPMTVPRLRDRRILFVPFFSKEFEIKLRF